MTIYLGNDIINFGNIMKKISKMFALGVTCLVSLTGCDLEGRKAFQNIENSMLQKAINDSCFGNASNDLSLSFTAYKIDENNELTKNIDLHAKVQSQNGYSSFLNMYYSNVPNTYFDIKEKSLSDTAKLYKAFEKIVISDLPYIFSNYQVNSFDSLDKTFKEFVPNVNS